MRGHSRQNADELDKELQHLLYVVSHDLGKYIRHMREFTNILLEDAREKFSEEELECADMLIRAANNSESMIQALLEYSRVETRVEPLSKVDCNALLEDVQQEISTMIQASEADIHIEDLPTVTADKRQLATVWKHVLSNALIFMEKGTRPNIHISAKDEEDRIVFSIKDNGIGIAEEKHEQIFQLFSRLHGEDEYPGMGAGLAVVKRILMRHGGEIWVNSTPGEGAEFCFSLPKQ